MIENLKDLERLLKLCRKQGVTDISLGQVSFKLGELPAPKHNHFEVEESENDYEGFPDDILTPEELAYFANGGKPEDNPYRRPE